jgi:transposase-like protein
MVDSFNDIHDYTLAEVTMVLKNLGGNVSATARELNVSRASLRRWIEKQNQPIFEEGIDDLLKLGRKMRDLEARLKIETKKRRDTEEALDQAEKNLKIATEVKEYVPVAPRPVQKKVEGTRTPATAIICACDWHAEENIQADIVNELNVFNPDICQTRVNRLWEKSLYLIEFARQICDIQEVVLWLGGDLINGYIHEEMQEGNFCGPTEAILFIQDMIAKGIHKLKSGANLESLRVVCNVGNHGRSIHKPRIATGYKTNWEYLGYCTMASQVWHPGVSWQIARGYFNYVDVQGYTCRFHHGEQMKYQGGSGGITIPVNKAIHQWNLSKRADYDIFGHWHQYLETWRWTSCGCLVGYGPYAMSIKAEYQEPTQTMIVIDKTRGKTMSIPIFVGEK